MIEDQHSISICECSPPPCIVSQPNHRWSWGNGETVWYLYRCWFKHFCAPASLAKCTVRFQRPTSTSNLEHPTSPYSTHKSHFTFQPTPHHPRMASVSRLGPRLRSRFFGPYEADRMQSSQPRRPIIPIPCTTDIALARLPCHMN